MITEKRISAIIRSMTVRERIALCSGKDFWHTKSFEKYGIPEVMMCDGPSGLRKQVNENDMLGINESLPATFSRPGPQGSWSMRQI